MLINTPYRFCRGSISRLGAQEQIKSANGSTRSNRAYRLDKRQRVIFKREGRPRLLRLRTYGSKATTLRVVHLNGILFLSFLLLLTEKIVGVKVK